MSPNEKLKQAIATNNASLAQEALSEGANPFVQVNGKSSVMALAEFSHKSTFSPQMWDVVEQIHAMVPSNSSELLEVQESVLQSQYQGSKVSVLAKMEPMWKPESDVYPRYMAMVSSSPSWLAYRKFADRLPQSQDFTQRMEESHRNGCLDGELAGMQGSARTLTPDLPFRMDVSSPTPTSSVAGPLSVSPSLIEKDFNEVGDYHDQVPKLTVSRVLEQRQRRQQVAPSSSPEMKSP